VHPPTDSRNSRTPTCLAYAAQDGYLLPSQRGRYVTEVLDAEKLLLRRTQAEVLLPWESEVTTDLEQLERKTVLLYIHRAMSPTTEPQHSIFLC